MDTRALQTFVAVAQELHFGRAAERLHVVQQAVSQQIRRLEDDLGTPLLRRTTRRVELTAAGATLLADASRILASIDEARRSVQAVGAGRKGSVQFGYNASAVVRLLPELVTGFAADHPDVELRFVELCSPRLEEQLLSGELALGLVGSGAYLDGLERAVVAEGRAAAVLPSNHPRASARSIGMEVLKDEPFVMYDPDTKANSYKAAMAVCLAAGFSPRIEQYASSEQAVLSLVAAGCGVGVISTLAADAAREGASIVEIEPAIPLRYRLAWRPDAIEGPARTFRDWVVDRWATAGDTTRSPGRKKARTSRSRRPAVAYDDRPHRRESCLAT